MRNEVDVEDTMGDGSEREFNSPGNDVRGGAGKCGENGNIFAPSGDSRLLDGDSITHRDILR